MNDVIYNEVIVYHDETKRIENTNLKGQILFFIPRKIVIKHERNLFNEMKETYNPLDKIYNAIKDIRKTYKANHKFHFKEIPKTGKWTKYNQAEKELVEMAIEALKSKANEIFSKPLFCKIAMIFYPMTHLNLYGGDKKEKRLRYHETLLRILLKGAVHYLYDECHPIKILISDGEPYHRKLSDDRILWRLIHDDLIGQSPLRNYVTISITSEIVHQLSQHKNFEEDTEEYINANMLQLADMLLGSVIHSCYKGIKTTLKVPTTGEKVVDKKGVISFPVKEMIEKRKRGRNFRYSSHYKSFSLTKAEIINGEWIFENIMAKEIEITPDGRQINLLDIY